MKRRSTAGIWIAAALIAVVPLIIIKDIDYPRPDLDELILQLAAGALPGVYFGCTTRTGTPRTGAGLNWIRIRLPVISKFAASALIGIALGAVAEATLWGLVAAGPAIAAATLITISSRLLDPGLPRRSAPLYRAWPLNRPSPQRRSSPLQPPLPLRPPWQPGRARPLAALPVIIGYAVIGLVCLWRHVVVDYDTFALHVIGVGAVAIACFAGLLAVGDITRGRSDRSRAPGARGRAG